MEFDPNRKIFKKLTDSDTGYNGKVHLPMRSLKNNLIDCMSPDLKRRVSEEKEAIEVVLHSVIDGSTSNVKLKLESTGYAFRKFYPVITSFELKDGDFLEFYPVVGEVSEPVNMEFRFSHNSPIDHTT
ncbi:hypothetical protein L1987_36782 [Smallanthus sonchifolius]|uniref:Uncharacterized protein n=1 Tax=Smallanthus sonchifolius TaxID=185202 RepID=A0ACB9HE56_9ASTR|nr:hypothetical protein L1987_36782 [Smallanthus sonchifolius]